MPTSPATDEYPAIVPVGLDERSYDVVVGRGLLREVPVHLPELGDAERAALVTQPPIAAHAQTVAVALGRAGLATHTLTVPDGETAKGFDELGRLYRALAAIPLGRRDVVVAVGGGVVGDLAGFLAATWHRGVRLVQVPTSTPAQVDAAIGGKTAVNLPEGKNLVGAFHQPVAVICDVDALATLPAREHVAGLAEVVKYGLIRDPDILALVESDVEGAVRADPDLMLELVRRSAVVKAAVVSADEREAGEREHLNLGHTFGHALEVVTGYGQLRHGEAVAIGTCVALRLGVRLGRTPSELVGRVERLLGRLGLPTRPPDVDRGAIWAAMARDKKARSQVRFVLLDDLARPVVHAPRPEDVDAAIDEVEAS